MRFKCALALTQQQHDQTVEQVTSPTPAAEEVLDQEHRR